MLIALDRKQSVDFLKEIIASNLVDASWVSIHEQERGNFVIKINAQTNKELAEYAKKNNLVVDEKDKGNLILSKPYITSAIETETSKRKTF